MCDWREDPFRAALFEFGQQHQRFPIRTQVEKVLRRDLSGHDCVMNVLHTKKFEEAIKLSDAHPFKHIDMLLQRWIGLTSECGSDYFFSTTFSRSIREHSRLIAFSANASPVA